MFEKFSDYMFNLLFTPLKKVRLAANQFHIFLKVIGVLFDDTKRDIFQIRRESMIISASSIMLSEHGRDRNMQRLVGETIEGYRTRLAMKGIIAEKAGTNQGILLALISLQLKRVRLKPYFDIDPERWAEFLVIMTYDIDEEPVIGQDVIRNEVRKVKPASAKDNYQYEYMLDVHNWEHYRFRLDRLVIKCHVNNYSYRPKRFDGQHKFDGSINFNQQITQHFHLAKLVIKSWFENYNSLKVSTAAQYQFRNEETVSNNLTVRESAKTDNSIRAKQVMIRQAVSWFENHSSSKLRATAHYQFRNEETVTNNLTVRESTKTDNYARARQFIIQTAVRTEERTSCTLAIDNRYNFDGQCKFDGKRKFNAAITREEF